MDWVFRCGNVRFGEAGKAAADRLSFRLTAPYSEERRHSIRSRSRSDGIHRQKNERKSYILTFVNEKLHVCERKVTNAPLYCRSGCGKILPPINAHKINARERLEGGVLR